MPEQSLRAIRGRPLLLAALVLTAPLLTGALATPVTAAASVRPSAVDPPPGRFVVQSINGTGCRPADTQVRPRDTSRVDVDFRALQARLGGRVPATARRAQCVLTLRAAVGRGYSFGVDTIVLRGRASLPEGTTATAAVSSWFLGRPNTGTVQRTIPGPYEATWDLRTVTRPASIRWSPCGADYQVNLRTEVRLRSTGLRAGDTARMTLDPGTNEPSASYHFAWKRC